MLDFMSELFILGFGAKSVVELFEDSVDIGEELRWAKEKMSQYRTVFRIRIPRIPKFLGLKDLDPDLTINR